MTSPKGPSSFFKRRQLRPSNLNNSRRHLSNRASRVATLKVPERVNYGPPSSSISFTSNNAANLALGPYNRRNSLTSELNALPVVTPSSSRVSSAFTVNSLDSNINVPEGAVLPMEANVEEVHLDPKVIFPDAVTHIVDLKGQISKVTRDIEAIRPGLKNAITAAQQLGVLNIGNKSFRGKNSPLVYVAHNTNVNDFVVRGDFTVDGRPFRVVDKNSFNSVLSQMKQKRQTAKTAIKGLSGVQDKVKGLETLLATLRQDLDKSTKKLRSNMRNYTAKHAKQMMRGLKPTTKVVSSANVKTAEALLQPKKSLWQRVTGRGGRSKKNATRRNTRR